VHAHYTSSVPVKDVTQSWSKVFFLQRGHQLPSAAEAGRKISAHRHDRAVTSVESAIPVATACPTLKISQAGPISGERDRCSC
jgi:hypothetical protein